MRPRVGRSGALGHLGRIADRACEWPRVFAFPNSYTSVMHHSDEHMPDDNISDEIRKELLGGEEDSGTVSEDLPQHLRDRLESAAKENDFGATDEHPEGKLADHDEGEIRFGITNHKGKVIINFGKSVRSLGMSPEQAKDLAGTLLNRARKA